MTPIGKCVKKTYRKVDICFTGPKCMAPFAEVGEPACFDDKVRGGAGERGAGRARKRGSADAWGRGSNAGRVVARGKRL